MKTLHYNLYEDGRIGMCNLLMSVECAIVIATLTERDKIIFYGTKSIFNSKGAGKNLFDLYDINFPHEFANEDVINEKILSLPCNFFNAVFYHKEKPSVAFVNGRTHKVDLSDYTDYADFRTLDNKTLGFYSYMFYLGDKKADIAYKIKSTVVPKKVYADIAKSFIDAIAGAYKNGFNSLHVRRGDYLHTDHETKNITGAQIAEFVKGQFQPTDLLILHTDEVDESYFAELKQALPNLWFIDKQLAQTYPSLDVSEIGLVSLLIASFSKEFVGTLFSTFTSYIHRYRLYNGLNEEFKYIYTQRQDYQLVNNKFKEGSHGENSWNRAELSETYRQVAFWIREWAECFPSATKVTAQQSLRVFPKFLTEEECKYIIGKMGTTNNEFYSNEKRNRTTFSIHGDAVLEPIARRACKNLGYDYDSIENVIQLFQQYEGGQTYTHVDSVHHDYQGHRIASILFYLNEDYEGSYIDFAYCGVRVKPKTGTMFAYPLLNQFNEQDKLWTHSSSLITKGTKFMCYFSLKEKPFNR